MVLGLHIVSRESNGVGNIIEIVSNVCRFDPSSRIVRMIVIAVHDQAVSFDEVGNSALVICKLTADMVIMGSLF